MLALLCYVVLLLVVMPALLLWFGALVKKNLENKPSFIGFPIDRATLIAEREAEERAMGAPSPPLPKE
jgi:hypothetical protein